MREGRISLRKPATVDLPKDQTRKSKKTGESNTVFCKVNLF
jgi:hypothetical protein